MKKILLLITVISALLFASYGFYKLVKGYQERTRMNAYEELKTPFIDILRYAYNNYDKKYAVLLDVEYSCKHGDFQGLKCTSKDIENIKKLAKTGDMFSLAAVSFIDIENADKHVKYGAGKGEPYSLYEYGSKHNDWSYLKKAKAKGYIESFDTLARMSFHHEDMKGFCTNILDGYKRWGIEYLSEYIVTKSPQSEALFSICLKKTKEEFLSEHNAEDVALIRGFQLVREKKFDEARVIFENIYKAGSTSKNSINAAFCLGIMYKSGLGAENNIAKSEELLKDANPFLEYGGEKLGLKVIMMHIGNRCVVYIK